MGEEREEGREKWILMTLRVCSAALSHSVHDKEVSTAKEREREVATHKREQ